MFRILLGLVFFLASVVPTHADKFGQQNIQVVNATPYQIRLLTAFSENGVTTEGGMDAFQTATVHVDDKSCVFELSADTPNGKVFSKVLNTCRGQRTWIIRNDFAI